MDEWMDGLMDTLMDGLVDGWQHTKKWLNDHLQSHFIVASDCIGGRSLLTNSLASCYLGTR